MSFVDEMDNSKDYTNYQLSRKSMASMVEIGWANGFTEQKDHLEKLVQETLKNRDKCEVWCGVINKYPSVNRLIRNGKLLL